MLWPNSSCRRIPGLVALHFQQPLGCLAAAGLEEELVLLIVVACVTVN